jgi:hypothetical protein
VIGRWRSLGPTLITDDELGATGRVTSIAIDETDPSTIYTAGRSGNPSNVGGSGVWKTTNGGSTWRPIADGLPSLKIAAIALAPGGSSPLYAATLNRSENGGGLYRSDDGGQAWDLVSDDEALSGRLLLIDPTEPARMFMANSDGVYRSTDSGGTWSIVLDPGSSRVTDLAIDPATPSRLYAGVSHDSNDSVTGVYVTRDSGDSWAKLLGCPGGRLPTDMAGRSIRLAVSRNRIYASFKSREEFVVYRTTEIGCSIGGQPERVWERGWTADSDVAPTIWSYLYAHPEDPDLVYATGTSFRRSTNAGSNFSVMSGPHVDHHALAVDPSDGDVVYTGCDGGLYRSNDRGASGSWTFVGEGMTNTEFYDIAHAPTDSRVILGGTQDNGTIRVRQPGTVWDQIRGGDGATVDVDPTDAEILYSMGQYASSIERQVNGGSWQGLAAGLPMGSVCFNLHYQVHPDQPTTLLASCGTLWRTTTTQPPGNWQMIFPVPGSPTPTGNVVRSALDGRSNVYYAATDDGELYAGVDGDGWERVFDVAADCGATAAAITDVEVDLDDSAVVYLATDGDDTCRVVRLRRSDPDELAMTAQDITFDLPEEVIVSALAIDRLNPGTIYVGTTDRAVYRGRPVGAAGTWRWDRYSDGLPLATCITDLLVHPATCVLRAGTCGRGAFEVDTDDPIGSTLAIEGRVTFLRVHDAGGFGPPLDHLDGEVVVRLDVEPDKAFGFQLRPDSDEGPHGGMLDVLRSAMIGRQRVRIEYVRTGPRNGRAIRVVRIG